MSEPPAINNLIALLQHCRRQKNLAYAKLVQSGIFNIGLESYRSVGNYMVPMFVECGSLPDAQQVFDMLVHRSEHSWTALMVGYIECGKSQHALNLYQEMQRDNVHPSIYTLTTLLKACANIKDVERGRQIHMEIAQNGFEGDIFVGSALVNMYAKCGSLAEAQEVFNNLTIQTVMSWNALIAGYAEHGPGQEALRCLEQMQLEGLTLDAVTYIGALKVCGSIKSLNKGRKIHSEITAKGFEGDICVCNSMIGMYAKCGSLVEAQEVFDNLPVQDVVSWNALIAGYTEHGPGQEALICLEQMQLEGISPNAVTFVCVLKACSSKWAIDKGREIHDDILQKGFQRHIFVGNTLVDMYAKCGSLVEAREVFDNLPVRNAVSWNALIAGYTENSLCEEAMKSFYQMQLEGLSPDAVTFVCILKACGSNGAIDKGREMHADISRKGYQEHIFVGNALVDMYAKCGSLTDAQCIFDTLRFRNVVSWNTLISAYAAEHGLGQEVLRCFELMQLEGISPDPVTFVYALKACGSIGALAKGLAIHADVAQKGFGRDAFVGNTLVAMYAKCGSLAEAQEVFDSLLVQDFVSWSAMIAGYAEHGPGQEALKCFEQMQLAAITPDSVTFVSVLKACGSIGAIGKGREVHADIVQKELEKHFSVGNTLVDMYAKCGSLAEAQDVFDNLPVRDAVAWTALIAGYAEHGLGREALKWFEQMELEGVSSDPVTLVCALKACSSIGALERGLEIHSDIVKRRFDECVFVGNALVDMYAKCGSMAEARGVFDKLSGQDAVSWSALIAGYAEHGPGEDALKIFEQMQLETHFPHAIAFVHALRACISIRAIDMGRELHAHITQKGLERDVFLGNVLIDMYAKCGSLADAQKVSDNLPVRDALSWTALIAGYAEHGPGQEALRCFEKMKQEAISADAVTYVCVLNACGSIGSIYKGREIHGNIVSAGLENDVLVGNTLIHMYAKCGSLAGAWNVFNNLPVRDVVSWTAMIEAYGMNDEGSIAVQLFEGMKEEGLKPDDITFTCVLAACSHARLGLKGREFFNTMREVYGIPPTINHYICMVILLAESGHLYEAEKFVEFMPCCPTWTALLSACKIYGEVELGFRCFQQLVQINPECAAPYMLMARIFASAGRWDDVYRIEELRRLAGAEKKPAVALIEVNQKLHEFVVGNNKSKEISAMLDILSSRMKEDGYVPNVNLVLRPTWDAEKETSLCKHSEKVAIALGFLNASQGSLSCQKI